MRSLLDLDETRLRTRLASGTVTPRRRRCTEGTVERADHFDRLRAGDRVVDVLAFPAGGHEVVRTQSGELLRDRGLAEIQGLFEIGDALLAFDQQTENNETNLMRQRLEELACLTRIVEHLVSRKLDEFTFVVLSRR